MESNRRDFFRFIGAALTGAAAVETIPVLRAGDVVPVKVTAQAEALKAFEKAWKELSVCCTINPVVSLLALGDLKPGTRFSVPQKPLGPLEPFPRGSGGMGRAYPVEY